MALTFVVAWYRHKRLRVHYILHVLHVTIIDYLITELEGADAPIGEGVICICDVSSNDGHVNRPLQRIQTVAGGDRMSVLLETHVPKKKKLGLGLVSGCGLERPHSRSSTIALNAVLVHCTRSEASEFCNMMIS